LLPDDRAAPYLKSVATLHVLAEALRGKLGPVDISSVSAKIDALLDEKIERVVITAPIIEGDEAGGRIDLSSIDFEKLATMFAQRPRTAAERLRADAAKKAREMVERNPTRIQLVEKLEKLVEAYKSTGVRGNRPGPPCRASFASPSMNCRRSLMPRRCGRPKWTPCGLTSSAELSKHRAASGSALRLRYDQPYRMGHRNSSRPEGKSNNASGPLTVF
jgi:hypothetical protein